MVPLALEAICLKAMAAKPEDRYPTAQALADDVEHWLGDEPVKAYREPWLQRLARWGRRHRPMVVGAAALLLTAVVALTAGIVVVRAEQTRTEMARQRTREALDEMSSQVIEDWLSRRVELEPAQRTFLAKALASYESFAAESGHTQEVRRSVAAAHQRIGRIRTLLGQHGEAEAAYLRSQELYSILAADFPSAPEFRLALAQSHRNLGVVWSDTGRQQEAETAYREAVIVYTALASDFPTVPQYREELASSYNNLGTLLRDMDRPLEAEKACRQALALYQILAADFPTMAQYRRGASSSHNNLGSLLATTGREADAEPAFLEALAIRKRLTAEFPNVIPYRRELAVTYNNLGALLRQTGRSPEAEVAYRDALAVQKPLVAEFPIVPEYRMELAGTHSNLGKLLKGTGRLQEAGVAYGDALAIKKTLASDFPKVPDYQADLANTLDGLAELAHTRRDFPSAHQLLEQAKPHVQVALKANPHNPYYRAVSREIIRDLAATLLDLGEHAPAADAAANLASIGIEPANDTYKAAGFLSRCLPLAENDAKLPETKRTELAKSYGDRAMEMLRQAVAKGYKDVAQLKKDTDFNPLRSRDDFKKLLAEMELKAK